MKSTELRIGNLVKTYSLHIGDYYTVVSIGNSFINRDSVLIYEDLHPIPLTEEWLLKFGFSIINENSAGKRYGYVIGGVFNSGLTFTFWKTTKEAGKFFRGDLELKSVHQLQNLYFALTNNELTL